MDKIKWEKVLPYYDKYAAVKLNGKWGYIDQQGELVVQPIYDSVEKANYWPDMYIAVSQDGKYGVLNKEFEEIIPPQYDEIGEFLYGVAAVRNGDKWGVVDTKGDLVAPITYTRTQPAPGGNAFVAVGFDEDTLLWGMIDKEGNLLIPTTHRGITQLHNSLIWGKKISGKSVLYKLNGEVVISGWEKWVADNTHWATIALKEKGIITQICVICKEDVKENLTLNIKGKFVNYTLSRNGWLWTQDKDNHIKIYNCNGELACELNDLTIESSSNVRLRGYYIRMMNYTIVLCKDSNGHLLFFDEYGEELYCLEKSFNFEKLYLAHFNHAILKGKSSSIVVSFKHKKMLRVKNCSKVYVLSEDLIGYDGGYIYSWTTDTKDCEEKGLRAKFTNHFVIARVDTSNLSTLITTSGKVLLENVENKITIHQEYCLVDSVDYCDIYDSEGNCCSVAGYRAYDKTTALGKDIVPLKGADNSISFFTVKGEFLYSLPKEVDKIGALRGNVIPVHNKECQKWGLINLSGQLISGYKYDAIKEGVIERCVDPSSTHKTFRSIDFLDIYERELQIFKRDGGETIIGDDGQESLPLLKGFVVVDKDSPNLFQFYDEENKKTKLLRIENGVAVWSASFDHIVLNKIIVGDLAGGREGLIDKKTFEILLPPIFDRAENNNRPAANLEGKWYRFSSDMSLINPATAYDDAFKDLDMCYY